MPLLGQVFSFFLLVFGLANSYKTRNYYISLALLFVFENGELEKNSIGVVIY